MTMTVVGVTVDVKRLNYDMAHFQLIIFQKLLSKATYRGGRGQAKNFGHGEAKLGAMQKYLLHGILSLVSDRRTFYFLALN